MAELNYFKFYIGKRLFARRFQQISGRFRGHVLDVGAGARPFRRFLTDVRLTAMDIEPARSPDIAGSAVQMPFQSQTFDGVICTEVLEHIADGNQCLSEIHRILRAGGVIYITAPMLWSLHYEPHDYYRFTNHGLRYMLEKNRFQIIRTDPIGGFFSFVFMRLGEKLFNLVHKLVFFLPKSRRHYVTIPLTLPLFVVLYGISLILDPCMRKDVFSWSVLACKPEPSPSTGTPQPYSENSPLPGPASFPTPN